MNEKTESTFFFYLFLFSSKEWSMVMQSMYWWSNKAVLLYKKIFLTKVDNIRVSSFTLSLTHSFPKVF